MQENRGARSGGSSKLFWTIMILGILSVGGLLTYFALSPAPPVASEVRLENAVREGSPEFEALKSRIAVQEDRDYATESQSMAGGIEMNLTGKIRNFSGKTLTGLEVAASVLDQKGNILRERTAIVLPNPVQQRVDNNKVAPFNVRIAGFERRDERADFRFRITAVKVE